MKLKDMDIRDILHRIDFPDGFLDRYAEWCSKQPPEKGMESDYFFGVNRNPFLAMVLKDEEE